MTRTRSIRALLLGATLALAAAAPAAAGTLTREGDTWVYRAAPGERNVFHVAPDDGAGGGYRFRDEGNAITVVGGGCHPPAAWDDATVARCPYLAGVRVELGDGDDRAYVSDDLRGDQRVAVDGGPGADHLRGPLRGVGVALAGGDGDDVLDGGRLDDVLDGGAGNDVLNGGDGDDVLRGGPGDDELAGDDLSVGADVIDGGPGRDVSKRDWIQRDATGMIAIMLDGVANDGHPGEGDDVVAVEEFVLDQPARFVAGADPVRVVIRNHGLASSHVTGGPGDDELRTHDYADVIDGGAGDDVIEGGHGDDVITGGPGRDTINAGAGTGSCNFLVCRLGSGNDTIFVRDGERDSVVCGDGDDRVVADAIDVVAPDCERVERPAAGGPAPQGDGGSRTRAPSGRRTSGRDRRCVVPRVRRGTPLAAARRALARAGCRARVKRVRSARVRRGRTVKLSARAGRRLPYRAAVTIVVSKGR